MYLLVEVNSLLDSPLKYSLKFVMKVGNWYLLLSDFITVCFEVNRMNKKSVSCSSGGATFILDDT